MTEILLVIIILSLLGYHGWYVQQTDKAKKELVDALIARSAQELRDLRVAGNTKIKIEPPKKGENPDFIPLEQLDDETLIKAMKDTYGK